MAGTLQARSAPERARAFSDLAAWRKIVVRGADAPSWLGDLVTAEVSSLRPGTAARSLLLTPTGRIRADFTVASREDGFLLLQHPEQPRSVTDLLAPYVLSSEVVLEDSSSDLTVLAFPGREPARSVPGDRSAPSCLGPGVDLIVESEGAETRRAAEQAGFREVLEDDLERWRVEDGTARFPVDLTETSLPHEAGLDRIVDAEKGCFLGQEAIAKVRNLGHPPWLVLAGTVEGPASTGEPITGGDREVGTVTSAAPIPGATAVILRVRWDARDLPLRTDSGSPVDVAGPASGPL
jgi:tRNA-modifying protein YgfZ